ncbi:TPA: hypothetical protein L4G69_002825 [Pseudomonas aeruginosa]|nr:hypothetical protein [Pseudomonas aeruginosa]HBO3198725.1 hypothetical protein [Pseudomonas aeruginosa]
MEQAMREEFEAWFVRNYAAQIKDGHHGFNLDRYEHPPHQYIHDTPHHDWRIWQASRAALRVEFPPTITAEEVVEHFNIDEEGIDMAAGIAHMVNGAIAACAAFIKKAGIEVNP